MMTEIFRLFCRLNRAEQLFLMARELAEPGDIVERIDETEIGKFGILAGDGCERRLDVQVRDIIRQDRHLVREQLLLVFVPEF